MIDFEQKPSYDVSDLAEIVRILRAPGGCPWDREQDHRSIRRDLLEEAYEVAEAIDEGSPEHLKEELGDLLLQVVMHARMEEEEGRTDLSGVADGICKKLIYRHPHVFGDVTVTGTGEVLANWDELKKKEKHQATAADSVDAVARKEELGDLLFAAVNVARFVKVDPEKAMTAACDKFARRFRAVEEAAAAQGKALSSMTLAEMDALWDQVKEQET